MNAIEQARAAYAPAQSPMRTGRSAEHQVLMIATSRLRAAAMEVPVNYARLAAALYDNRRLWTRLATDVADEANGLPKQLRAQIFYLAEFTDFHSSRVLRGEGDVQALIDINTAVMRGLGSKFFQQGAQ